MVATCSVFFFNDTATTEIYTLSLHDALPISWTKKLWIYDFRTNVHMTLKTKRLKKSDFDEFIELYKADDRSKRRESKKHERWKEFSYDEIIPRDKTN